MCSGRVHKLRPTLGPLFVADSASRAGATSDAGRAEDVQRDLPDAALAGIEAVSMDFRPASVPSTLFFP